MLTNSNLNLDPFSHPESVAVVGASENVKSFGSLYLLAQIQFGYTGRLYPVNQNGRPILGLTTYRNVGDIPEKVDLAVISVPSRFVSTVLKDCIKKGIHSAIVLSSGFSESSEEGRLLEAELTQIAKAGIRIIGPNCFGMYCPSGKVTIIPGGQYPKNIGSTAFLSQSGQFSEMVIGRLIGEGVRFSKVISYGNACDINEADLLEYLAKDEETKIIQLYIEGVKDGRRFLEVARKYSNTKPILIWKVGLTSSGRIAASSHTGSLVGSSDVWNAFFLQSRVIKISNLDDLIDACVAFNCYPEGCGSNVALVSGGGGGTVVGADAADFAGITLPVFSLETQNKISALLPAVGISVKNPVDIGPPTQPLELLTRVLEAVASSDQIDVIIIRRIFFSVKMGKIITGSHPVSDADEQQLMDIPIVIKDKYRKPVIIVLTEENTSLDTLEVEAERRRLRDYYMAHGIPVYLNESRAMTSISHLAKYKKQLQSVASNNNSDSNNELGKKSTWNTSTICRIESKSGKVLSEIESKGILKRAGINVVETKFSVSKNDAIAISKVLGFPVVMKIVSPQITHKSDIGGVKLGLKSSAHIKMAYDEITNAVRQKFPEAVIDGISVQKMARPGVEVIIGMTRDPQFGPIIMFGLGGILVELLKDVSFRIAPLALEDARSMIQEIKGFPVLQGYRGQEAVDTSKLEDIILKLSDLAINHPEIREVDMNPVFAYRDEALVVDARVVLE